MKSIYNWKTNILDFEDKYKNHYYLKLRGDKNVIKGNSGTGKTYLYNKLEAIKKRLDSTSNYDAENIILLNKDNLITLDTLTKKLIIIDNADLLLTEKQVDFINMDDNNRYLIFTRVPIGLDISPNHQADLVQEGDKTIMQYRFSVKGWC